ncbi:MAG: ImmA/IrrE family metallo-endopeptidase [Ruthenibacterium sp.]
MIQFHCEHSNPKNKTPIIKDIEIEGWAENLLADYKPRLLEAPAKINAFHFLESYLGANLEYQDIYYGEDESPIVGATAFNEEYLPVFDRDAQRVMSKKLHANTVVLDNSIMKNGKEGFALFTALHEGGHLFMHPAVYHRDVEQLNLFEMYGELPPVVCCRRNVIEGHTSRPDVGQWTDEDFREHQANVFACAIAMPKRTFFPYAQNLIVKSGYPAGMIVAGNRACENIDIRRITTQISRTYGVSKSAALVNLKKCGLYQEADSMMQKAANQ